MSWNYRVVHETEAISGPDEIEIEDVFTIREIYYDANGEPEMWSADPCSPQGDNLASLREDIDHMLRALDQPVIEITDLPSSSEQTTSSKREDDRDCHPRAVLLASSLDQHDSVLRQASSVRCDVSSAVH